MPASCHVLILPFPTGDTESRVCMAVHTPNLSQRARRRTELQSALLMKAVGAELPCHLYLIFVRATYFGRIKRME